MPFNKKLGYVQCDIFYEHLTTHFNKHENDVLTPSKCQHCVKCILHVRHMREHLNSDHKRNQPENANNESELDEESDFKLTDTDAKNLSKNEEDDEDYEVSSVASDATSSSTTVKSTRGRKKSVGKKEKSSVKSLRKEIAEKIVQQTGVRKRRRSTMNQDAEDSDKAFEDEATASSPFSEDTALKSNSKSNLATTSEPNENVYDFSTSESDQPQTKGSQRIKNKRTSLNSTTNSKSKTSESSSDPIMPASSPSSSSVANSEHSSDNFVLKSSKKQQPVAAQEQTESRSDPNGSVEVTPRPRKQKALKQTTIKRLQRGSLPINNNASSPASSTSISGKRRYRRLNANDNHTEATEDNPNSPTSPSHPVSTLLFGKIQFNCIKKEFKCVECNETDLKSHYK